MYQLELQINKTTGLNKDFGFIISREHVFNEILKLHGIKFHQKKRVLEEATSKPKKQIRRTKCQYYTSGYGK